MSSTIFRLSLAANYDPCSSVCTAVEAASWTWNTDCKSWEIMRLGRINTILDQTRLIWIKILVKDKETYPKPWSSHDYFIVQLHFHLDLKEKLSLHGGTHSYVYTATSRDWSLTTSASGMDWFTTTLFWAIFSDVPLWVCHIFFLERLCGSYTTFLFLCVHFQFKGSELMWGLVLPSTRLMAL